jgi:hypothetical protein
MFHSLRDQRKLNRDLLFGGLPEAVSELPPLFEGEATASLIDEGLEA